MMGIGSKTLLVSIAQLASSMERIVVFMILSRTLSVQDYGTYQQVWLFYLLVLPMFMLGLPSSILYFIPKAQPENRKTVVYQTVLLLEIIGIIFCIFSFLIAPEMARRYSNPSLVLYMRIFSFYPLFSVSPKLLNLLMVANNQPIKSAIVSATYSIITIVFITTPSFFKLPLVYSFYGALLGGGIFFIGFLLYLNHYYQKERVYWDLKLLRNQFFYSLPLGLSSILGTLSTQINRLVVTSSFSIEDFAIFTNGAFEVPFIGLITGSLMTVLIPEFVTRLKNNQDLNSVWELWNSSTQKTAILLFPIAVSLFVFAPDFMVLLFSEKYLASSGIFRIYLLLMILRVTQYGSLLQAMGKTSLILITAVSGLLITLFLSIFSVPIFGLIGPALANVISTYSWGAIYLVMLTKLTNISFSKIMPWKKLGTLLSISILAGLLSIPITYVKLNLLIKFILEMTVYCVIYVSLIYAFRIVDRNTVTKFMTEINLNISRFIRRPRKGSL